MYFERFFLVGLDVPEVIAKGSKHPGRRNITYVVYTISLAVILDGHVEQLEVRNTNKNLVGRSLGKVSLDRPKLG